jgi:PTH1 family peptidyl-tRNA hydrolase
MFLIVGLGNPGEKYANTRHNLGFEALDYFAHKRAFGAFTLEKKFKAEIIQTGDIILAKPQTYMNLSGMSVAKITNFYKIPPQNVVIIHDELDIVLGHIKIRLGGSAAGHHGVESIIEHLKSDQFVRFRLGIGNQKSFSGERKQIDFQAEKFVIDYFVPGETSAKKALLKKCMQALDVWLQDGLEKAQNQFNERGF